MLTIIKITLEAQVSKTECIVLGIKNSAGRHYTHEEFYQILEEYEYRKKFFRQNNIAILFSRELLAIYYAGFSKKFIIKTYGTTDELKEIQNTF